MFNLYPTFKERRFTETTATPKNTFTKDSDEHAALTSWIADVDALRRAVYNKVIVKTATDNDIFTAWKQLFRYFPEKLVGTVLHAESADVEVFIAACGRYVKADNGGKEWRDNTSGQFRKIVEDTIVDRVEGNKNKPIETIEAERKARTEARKAKKQEQIDAVCALLGCKPEEAKLIIAARQKKNKYTAAKAEYNTQERKLAQKLDAAESAEVTAA